MTKCFPPGAPVPVSPQRGVHLAPFPGPGGSRILFVLNSRGEEVGRWFVRTDEEERVVTNALSALLESMYPVPRIAVV